METTTQFAKGYKFPLALFSGKWIVATIVSDKSWLMDNYYTMYRIAHGTTEDSINHSEIVANEKRFKELCTLFQVQDLIIPLGEQPKAAMTTSEKAHLWWSGTSSEVSKWLINEYKREFQIDWYTSTISEQTSIIENWYKEFVDATEWKGNLPEETTFEISADKTILLFKEYRSYLQFTDVRDLKVKDAVFESKEEVEYKKAEDWFASVDGGIRTWFNYRFKNRGVVSYYKYNNNAINWYKDKYSVSLEELPLSVSYNVHAKLLNDYYRHTKGNMSNLSNL